LVGGAAVLPDDCAVDRLAGRTVPNDDGLALVRDADPGDTLRLDRLKRLAGHAQRLAPDLLGIMLNPAALGIMLADLALGDGDWPRLAVEQYGAGRRGPLVDRQDVIRLPHAFDHKRRRLAPEGVLRRRAASYRGGR
jgi:hypothetical protein